MIRVTVADRMAARNVELVAPGGRVQPAYNLATHRDTRTESGAGGWGFGPSVGVGVGGGSGGIGTGIGLSLPLGVFGSPSATATIEQTVTTAYIRIPDAIDYRQNWQRYKIRMQLGEPPDLRFVTIEAPPPPPRG